MGEGEEARLGDLGGKEKGGRRVVFPVSHPFLLVRKRGRLIQASTDQRVVEA